MADIYLQETKNCACLKIYERLYSEWEVVAEKTKGKPDKDPEFDEDGLDEENSQWYSPSQTCSSALAAAVTSFQVYDDEAEISSLASRSIDDGDDGYIDNSTGQIEYGLSAINLVCMQLIDNSNYYVR